MTTDLEVIKKFELDIANVSTASELQELVKIQAKEIWDLIEKASDKIKEAQDASDRAQKIDTGLSWDTFNPFSESRTDKNLRNTNEAMRLFGEAQKAQNDMIQAIVGLTMCNIAYSRLMVEELSEMLVSGDKNSKNYSNKKHKEIIGHIIEQAQKNIREKQEQENRIKSIENKRDEFVQSYEARQQEQESRLDDIESTRKKFYDSYESRQATQEAKLKELENSISRRDDQEARIKNIESQRSEFAQSYENRQQQQESRLGDIESTREKFFGEYEKRQIEQEKMIQNLQSRLYVAMGVACVALLSSIASIAMVLK